MSRNSLGKWGCLLAVIVGCSPARALEPQWPAPYLYTVNKLYADFVAADRARWLASQMKGATVSPNAEARYQVAWAYVAGVADALNDKLFCAPPGSDMAGTVQLYVEKHAEMWDRPASLAVEQALMEKFPCETTSPDHASLEPVLLKYDRH